MTNTENAARYSTMTGGLMVARRSAYRTKTWVSQIGQAPWLAPDRLPAELEHVRAQPPVIALNLNKVTDAITNLLAAIRKGELAAQAALLRAEHEIRSAIW